ncbi:ribosomal 60S subunit protein L35B [Starmerella bacillaris]|uniref:Ribosomal 60S subunit protein L35B n=1 Tax=Starmerella bacillaris TaxID=1247836 RepID=A0AAV5RNE0_STABA|nr:ribosomal 60S subunit protein L35B [Starmerella bacillaris]
MSDIKIKDIRELSDEQLKTQLIDLKENLLQLRAKKANVRSGEIHRVRKNIARVLTVINLKARSEVLANTSNPRRLPKDIRPKLTRALRRKLSASDANRRTLKAQKKSAAFPHRKYALKA